MRVLHSGQDCTEEKPCRVAAIVLAAGSSRRMGPDNKLLLEIDGRPLVRSSVMNAISSHAQPTIVVLGHEAEDVANALKGLEYQAEINTEYAGGMSSSLRAGIKAAEGFDAVAIMLADMPWIQSSTLNALLTVFSQQQASTIVIATHRGRQGHPVIWPATYFPELLSLNGDVGAKQLLKKYSHQVMEVEVDSDGIFMDIDTPADLKAANLQREKLT